MEQTIEIKTVAPLANVVLARRALERAMSRAAHLPGMVVLYGPAGWGKSFSAAYVANRLRGYYVECKSAWTRKALLLAILKEMGITPAKTLYEMVDQIAEQLVLSGRPLIVDEFDYLADKSAVEIIRDIYEASHAAILLIGEEMLPARLKRWERFHRRVLSWVPAQPASLEDAQHLAKLYAPKLKIADDLLTRVHELAHGSAGRIVVNVDLIRDEAASLGTQSIDLKTWGDRTLYTGDAPKRRL